jgi:hypothetical protein
LRNFGRKIKKSLVAAKQIMANFDLKKIAVATGTCPIYQLTIDDNPDYTNAESEEERNRRKTGVLDEYEKNLESKYKKNMVQIYNTVQRVSNMELVPKEKFRQLQGRKKNDPYPDFEFKHGDLRVYAIAGPGGKIIIFGGFKNEQEEDIKKMRVLKLKYFENLNAKK